MAGAPHRGTVARQAHNRNDVELSRLAHDLMQSSTENHSKSGTYIKSIIFGQNFHFLFLLHFCARLHACQKLTHFPQNFM
jgi:hypothetical protein